LGFSQEGKEIIHFVNCLKLEFVVDHRAEIIREIRRYYPFLSEEFGVKRIGIFGSVARGENNAQSDVDLVVEFSRPIGLKFVDFVEQIEKLVGKKVDVLTEEGVKNIRVKTVSSEIEKDIIYV
jgi:predicted nucleotidyltransferase